MVQVKNLYLISQYINRRYDTYGSAVVCAYSKEETQKIHPSYSMDIGYNWWEDPWVNSWDNSIKEVSVQYLGKAQKSIKLGIICSSFNAG